LLTLSPAYDLLGLDDVVDPYDTRKATARSRKPPNRSHALRVWAKPA
jgi:hypothetical protein